MCTLLRLAPASTSSYILFEGITQVFFMIIPLLFKTEDRATAWLPAHKMSSLFMGVVLTRFNVLKRPILIVQALDTKGTSKLWMGNPMGMLFHEFGDVSFVLARVLAIDTCIVSKFVEVVNMDGQIGCSAYILHT